MWNASGKVEERRVIGRIRHRAALEQDSHIEITNGAIYVYFFVFSTVVGSSLGICVTATFCIFLDCLHRGHKVLPRQPPSGTRQPSAT